MFTSGADLVTDPFGRAIDRSVDLLRGGIKMGRSEIPRVALEENQVSWDNMLDAS